MVTIRNYTGFETGDFSETRPSAGFGTRSVSATAARSGSYGFLVNPGDSTTGYEQFRYISSTTGKEGLGTAQTEAWRFDFRAVALPSSASRFLVVVTGNQIYFTLDNTGTIRAYYDPNFPTLLGTSPSGAITANTWHVVEIKATCGSGNSTDFIELRVDGVTQFTNSAASISSEGGTFDNGLLLGRNNTPGGAIEFHYDNVVTSDDWLPSLDVDITAFEPTGDSASNVNWTASAGNKWACLDEFPPSATDYISSGTSAGDQLYSATHASMATKGVAGKAILGVKTTALMREATSTTTLGRIGIRAGSTNYETSDVDIGSTTVITMAKIYQSNPDTSADWTDAEVNAAEPLVVRSTSDTSNIRCVALYLMVLTIPLMAAAGASADIQFEGTASTFLAQFPAGAPASIQFEGTVSTYMIVTPIDAGAPADVQFTGNTSTFTLLMPAGVPVDVQFTGSASTFTLLMPAGVPVDVQFEGTVSNPSLLLDSSENAAINVTEAESIAADVASAETAAVNVTEAEALAADVGSSENAAINVTETHSIEAFGNFAPKRLRVDVYSPAGVRLGGGPIRSLLASDYEQNLDEIGRYSFTIAANHPSVSLLTDGCEVWLYREGEGLVCKGIVDRSLWQANNDATLTISGSSTTSKLNWSNTLLGRKYSLQPATTVLTDLLSGTDFSVGAVDAGLNNVTLEYTGVKTWAAAKRLGEYLGVHIREDLPNSEVDLGAFGASTGIVLRSVVKSNPTLEENTTTFPITRITKLRDSSGLINKIIPLGAGEGTNRLDLRYSDRISPYTIQTAAGPSGDAYYWLEDATSIAAYGERVAVMSWKDIAPQENTTAAHVNASNMLYDACVDQLQRSKDPLENYTVDTAGIRQYEGLTGVPYFQLGEKFTVWFRGIDSEGVWLNVENEELFIMGFRRSFDKDGRSSFSFKLSNVDKLVETDSKRISNAFSEIKSMQLAHRPFNYREIHGPYRQTVNNTYPMDFTFRYDGNVSYLLLARLEFRIKPLRANATGSAAGGATSPTTSSGGSSSPTSSSGGSSSPTSSGGSAHTHSVTGTTSASVADDGFAGSSNTTAATGTPSTASTQAQSTSHTHNETGTVTGLDNSNHTHSLNNHTHDIGVYRLTSTGGWDITVLEGLGSPAIGFPSHSHSVSGQTAQSEASHTHTVTIAAHTHTVTIDAHTHTVTLSDHTHTLSYDVFEQSASATPGIGITINGVDRTVALGGPWNTDQNLDITTYLIDVNEQPLRQQHTILLTVASGKLLDLDVTLRSMVTANSVAPV